MREHNSLGLLKISKILRQWTFLWNGTFRLDERSNLMQQHLAIIKIPGTHFTNTGQRDGPLPVCPHCKLHKTPTKGFWWPAECTISDIIGCDDSKSLLPHRVVRARTMVSGIRILWDGTSFYSSNAWLERTLKIAPLTCIDQWHLEFILDLLGITGMMEEYPTLTARSKADVSFWRRSPMPVMHHMREVSSSKSRTRREWIPNISAIWSCGYYHTFPILRPSLSNCIFMFTFVPNRLCRSEKSILYDIIQCPSFQHSYTDQVSSLFCPDEWYYIQFIFILSNHNIYWIYLCSKSLTAP